MTSILSFNHLFWLWFAGKLALLTITLLPLAIYAVINGYRRLYCVWRQVGTIGAIVAIRLVIDVVVWSKML